MSEIVLTDFELTRIFFSIILLLASAHGIGYFFQRMFGIPKVIGEILGGLILGPTILGFFFPTIHQWIFQAFATAAEKPLH